MIRFCSSFFAKILAPEVTVVLKSLDSIYLFIVCLFVCFGLLDSTVAVEFKLFP